MGTPVPGFGSNSWLFRALSLCLWGGVVFVSVAALWSPAAFWPLVAFQVVYKALFLGLLLLPATAPTLRVQTPKGLILIFVAIVAVWPFCIAEARKTLSTSVYIQP